LVEHYTGKIFQKYANCRGPGFNPRLRLSLILQTTKLKIIRIAYQDVQFKSSNH